MDEKRPKRRRDKYNPYILSKKDNHYFIFFNDGEGSPHYYEIDKPLYDLFDSFELEDLSYLNEVDRNIEHSELTEASLNKRAFDRPMSIEDTITQAIQVELLHKAIETLTETQRRRLYLYYFVGLTYDKIAEVERCTFQAVAKSVSAAEKILKKYFFSGLNNCI